MHAPKNITKSVRAAVGVPMRPLKEGKRIFDREQEDAHRANANLSQAMIFLVAGAAIFALIEDMLSGAMQFSFYSTLETSDFNTYHKWTPVAHIVGAFAFMFAVYNKNVRYWLVYAIPALLIIHDLVLLGLIYGYIQPSDLAWLDFGPGWWRSA